MSNGAGDELWFLQAFGKISIAAQSSNRKKNRSGGFFDTFVVMASHPLLRLFF